MHRFQNCFRDYLSSKHLDRQLRRWNFVIRTTLQQSSITWEWILQVFFTFSLRNEGERIKLRGSFWYRWKNHRPTSSLRISISRTVFAKIAKIKRKNPLFSSEGLFQCWIHRTRSRDTPDYVQCNKRNWPFQQRKPCDTLGGLSIQLAIC